MVRGLFLTVVSVLALSVPALAEGVQVQEMHAYEGVSAVKVAGVFGKMTSSQGDVLLSADTKQAGRTELHTVKEEDGVMKMRAVEALEIPAGGEALVLERGGDHIMLFDMDAPLKAGQSFVITLNFEKGGAQDVMVTVLPQNENMDDEAHHDHDDGHEGH